ncbi:MAG: methyl-accepting chemotaxis protein [Spirochaetia bacterium]
MRKNSIRILISLNLFFVVHFAFIQIDFITGFLVHSQLFHMSIGQFFSQQLVLVTTVMPYALLAAAGLFIYLKPLQNAINKIDSGAALEKEEKQKARSITLFLYPVILMINVIGFTLGFLLGIILSGNISLLFTLEGLLSLLFNLATAMVYAQLQNAINEMILMKPRIKLRVYHLQNNKSILSRYSIMKQLFQSVFYLILFIIFTIIQVQSAFGYYSTNYSRILEETIRSGGTLPEAFQNFEEFIFSSEESRLQPRVPRYQADIHQLNASVIQNRKESVLLWTVISMLILSTLILLITANHIAMPIRRLRSRMRDIVSGDGDLTERITIIGNNEIGELTDLINSFVSKLGDIIRDIATSAKEVQVSADNLNQSIQEVSSSSQEMSASIRGVADSTSSQNEKVMTAGSSLGEIHKAIEKINSNISSQAAFTEQTFASVDRMAQNMRSVQDTTENAKNVGTKLVSVAEEGRKGIQDTGKSIKDIDASNNKVKQITGLISEITQKTDLLAINAAIEAAHAGDSGKGFAVVAGEIRNLASTSGTHAQDIENQIKTMTSIVKSGVTLSHSIEERFTQIADDIYRANQMIGEITSSAKEQTNHSEDVRNAMESIVASIQEARQSVEDLYKQSGNVTQIMQNLSQISTQIYQAANEQARENDDIMEAITQVRTVSENTNKVVTRLNNVISRFKVD